MTNSAYSLLLSVQNILNSEIDPILEAFTSSNDYSLQLSQIQTTLNSIESLILNARPNYYGLFTCASNFPISYVGQLVPFDTIFGGNLSSNPDGSIDIPPNTNFIIDFEINGTYSVSSFSNFSVYDCDTGEIFFTILSVSENFNSASDHAEIRTSMISSGATGRRIGVKVAVKQASGTLTLTQYQSFIKLVEV